MDGGIINETMAFSVETLQPCNTYELTFETKQIGLTVGKDLPLRVVGFTAIPQPNNKGTYETPTVGPAECTGRVHIGDQIIAVNGQDIAGIPRKDAVEMIACKRPVSLEFRVTAETSSCRFAILPSA